MKYQTWLSDYFANRKTERLGQAFCNDFIKQPWPELYYEEDVNKAETEIYYWLCDNQYIEQLPQKVR
nr:MAG TPA: hypothetical protein [Caudoviricetes sp.]